ncbi:tropomyosin [Rhynchospora pubera]|uniref:Tropomyosin n=1 Tax=Rhynchospora pubera TaxID=906938 RepID=A0AAV8FFU1_9POAL|nr:tropomyosin [Rhynchospora pubera]
MEEYLENLKSFRSYMKDVEDEAAKRSVEEQMQQTAIDTLTNDLNQVRSEVAKVNEETDEMIKEKNKVEWEINEKQKKISSLETECSTLKQTLELLHQEINTISEKLGARRSFYTNTIENFVKQLKDQQEWINKNKLSIQDELLLQVEGFPSKRGNVEGDYGFANERESEKMETQNCEEGNGLKYQMEASKQQMEALEAKKCALISETIQNKELLDQEKKLMEAMPCNLAEMELNALEEEQKALSGDKAGEMEYIQSLQDRINALKEISCGVTCQCGLQYQVELTRGN